MSCPPNSLPATSNQQCNIRPLTSPVSVKFVEHEKPEPLTDWQMVAVFATMRRRLCIISGGPGTGKTRTVVLLLALMLEQHPIMRIAMAAPTGKAAARLQEVVKNAKATLAWASHSRGSSVV